jgi:hypothetical protein
VFVAALSFGGGTAPAAAAPSTATQVAAAFPDDSFYIKNPAQQAKCVMPTTPSFIGPLTIQPCGDFDQLFFAFAAGGGTELVSLFAPLPTKCLAADTSNRVYMTNCVGASNRSWQLVGRTVKNRGTGKCLSANSANAVYTATCDGAINRNWEFPADAIAADSEAVHAASAARRAELADAAR